MFLIASCLILLGCSQKLPLEVDKEGGFQLIEISLTEAVKRQPKLAFCGQTKNLPFEKIWYGEDSTIPNKEVKKYPQFKGLKQLYGSVRFDKNFDLPGSGTEYFFALDSPGAEGYDLLGDKSLDSP